MIKPTHCVWEAHVYGSCLWFRSLSCRLQQEHCVAISHNYLVTGRWNDDGCHKEHSFVCSRKKCQQTLRFLLNIDLQSLTRTYQTYRHLSICLILSKHRWSSTPNQEPVPGWLHLLVPELLQAGGGAGDLGRSSDGLRAAGRQPGQHRHELRPGLRRRSGAAGQSWCLDRTQARGKKNQNTVVSSERKRHEHFVRINKQQSKFKDNSDRTWKDFWPFSRWTRAYIFL